MIAGPAEGKRPVLAAPLECAVLRLTHASSAAGSRKILVRPLAFLRCTVILCTAKGR
jgi:hypothetical protein